MDLVKKNIHMDHTKADAVTQLTFDEDMKSVINSLKLN